MIRFRQVCKRYGDQVVLDHLDLSVGRGEKVTIIGPSGSGKTTILRMLMTLEKLDSGVVEIDGEALWHEDLAGTRPASGRHLHRMREKVGMVFQQFNLFPHMSVMRNITEAPIHVLGLSKAEATERAEDLLKLVGMESFRKQRPGQLSGGQQQRVAIARALAMQPKVMLFDEVTSALDPELVGEVLHVIENLAEKTDMTMLLVTHEMRFAEHVSDRVIMFDHGQVVEQGPPTVILRAPEHERTRRFLQAVLDRD